MGNRHKDVKVTSDRHNQQHNDIVWFSAKQALHAFTKKQRKNRVLKCSWLSMPNMVVCSLCLLPNSKQLSFPSIVSFAVDLANTKLLGLLLQHPW